MTDVKHKIGAPFDEQIIREFLLDNPDFFCRYPELLMALRMPHQQRGTVSLVERHQELLRDRIRQLEEEITALMSEARRNEKIFRLNNGLQFKLLECEDMGEVRQCLSQTLMGEFGFTHVRLITVHDLDSELSAIWSKRLGKGHYFGRLTEAEARRLFGTDVGSVALTRLSEHCGQVVFAIASEDPAHFTPEMDNLLLEQLRRLLDHLLPRL